MTDRWNQHAIRCCCCWLLLLAMLLLLAAAAASNAAAVAAAASNAAAYGTVPVDCVLLLIPEFIMLCGAGRIGGAALCGEMIRPE